MINRPFPFSRTCVRAVLLMLGVWALAPATTAGAFTPAKGGSENTPLNISPTQAAGHAASSSSGGPSIVRTIVGLVIVLAVIWGLTWILKQVKSGRESRGAGSGLESVATLPLGSGRSLHLVRAGNDHLLVGSAEQGVVPVFRYSEEQARAAGLLEDEQLLLEAQETSSPKRLLGQRSGEPPRGPSPSPPGSPRTNVTPQARGAARRAAGGGRGASGPIQIPGEEKSVLDRLREWTERR